MVYSTTKIAFPYQARCEFHTCISSPSISHFDKINIVGLCLFEVIGFQYTYCDLEFW